MYYTTDDCGCLEDIYEDVGDTESVPDTVRDDMTMDPLIVPGNIYLVKYYQVTSTLYDLPDNAWRVDILKEPTGTEVYVGVHIINAKAYNVWWSMETGSFMAQAV